MRNKSKLKLLAKKWLIGWAMILIGAIPIVTLGYITVDDLCDSPDKFHGGEQSRRKIWNKGWSIIGTGIAIVLSGGYLTYNLEKRKKQWLWKR